MSENDFEYRDIQKHSLNERFVALLLEYQKRIYGFILTLVPNFSDADDIMQQTAMVMCRKFEEFKPNSNFLAWATRIARYEINNFRRKKRNSLSLLKEEAFEQVLSQTDIMLYGTEERLRALRKCLAKLSKQDAGLLKMHYEEGVTIKVISERIERSTQGLYKTFARIHNILRQCVDRTLLMWGTT